MVFCVSCFCLLYLLYVGYYCAFVLVDMFVVCLVDLLLGCCLFGVGYSVVRCFIDVIVF